MEDYTINEFIAPFISQWNLKGMSEILTQNSLLDYNQVMSPHHTDQMFQWSQVSRIALCMAKVKVTDSVS